MKLETQTQKLVIYWKGAGLFPIRYETIRNTKVITQQHCGGYLQTVVTWERCVTIHGQACYTYTVTDISMLTCAISRCNRIQIPGRTCTVHPGQSGDRRLTQHTPNMISLEYSVGWLIALLWMRRMCRYIVTSIRSVCRKLQQQNRKQRNKWNLYI